MTNPNPKPPGKMTEWIRQKLAEPKAITTPWETHPELKDLFETYKSGELDSVYAQEFYENVGRRLLPWEQDDP